jgi:hypothetical protein
MSSYAPNVKLFDQYTQIFYIVKGNKILRLDLLLNHITFDK